MRVVLVANGATSPGGTQRNGPKGLCDLFWGFPSVIEDEMCKFNAFQVDFSWFFMAGPIQGNQNKNGSVENVEKMTNLSKPANLKTHQFELPHFEISCKAWSSWQGAWNLICHPFILWIPMGLFLLNAFCSAMWTLKKLTCHLERFFFLMIELCHRR